MSQRLHSRAQETLAAIVRAQPQVIHAHGKESYVLPAMMTLVQPKSTFRVMAYRITVTLAQEEHQLQ